MKRLFPILLLISLSAGLSCSRQSETRSVVSFRVSENALQASAPQAIDEATLLQELKRSLAARPRFSVPLPGEKPPRGAAIFHCRLDAIVLRESAAEGASETASAEAGVSLELWQTEGKERLSALGIGQIDFAAAQPEARRQAFLDALRRALAQATEVLTLQLDASAKPTARLIDDLTSPRREIRDFAIRQLGERQAREAVVPLMARLQDPEEELVLRAAGALGAIGDAQAVSALIDAAQKQQPPALMTFLSTIALLGGPEAEGYLFTLSSGHPTQDIRALAAAHLRDVERRRALNSGAQNGANSK